MCGKKIPRKIHWFSDNGRNYLCAASCPEHGLIKGKARVRQNADGEWFVIKTTRQITDEEFEKVKERRETLRARRKLHRSS